MSQVYSFSAPLWIYQAEKGAWYFITLPVDIADEISFLHAERKRGWGSLRVSVTVGTSQWETSIFPDKKSHSYLLPIKATVRKEEKISLNQEVSLQLSVLDQF